MGTVASLWRYPIKAIGREEVPLADFTAGQTMPGDRVWAIAHQKSEATNEAWSRCGNFVRACNSPTVHAVTVATSQDGQLTFTHPDHASLQVDPDSAPDALLAWLSGLLKDDRFDATRVVKVPGRGMTDAPFPSVTLCNLSSHKAVEGRAGLGLSIHRWRGNIWLDGLAPWEEFDWIGRDVQIGEAVFHVVERTGRCKATHVNPDTGRRDLPVLDILEDYGHTDFSVQAEVKQSGRVSQGDRLTVL